MELCKLMCIFLYLSFQLYPKLGYRGFLLIKSEHLVIFVAIMFTAKVMLTEA